MTAFTKVDRSFAFAAFSRLSVKPLFALGWQQPSAGDGRYADQTAVAILQLNGSFKPRFRGQIVLNAKRLTCAKNE
jgi:hypothetical protein